jgi:hypothetical protein
MFASKAGAYQTGAHEHFSGAPSTSYKQQATNIRANWKGLFGTSTLALSLSISYKEKSIVTLHPGACTIKLFKAVIVAI